MRLEKQREEVLQYAKKLFTSGLTHGTGGNASVFDEESGLVVITPSGIPYTEMTAEDMVLCDLDGKVVEGKWKPSSELELHSIYYRKRKDLKAILHAHTVYATAVACMREDLPPLDYMIAVAGYGVRCAEYATFGTPALAENAFKAMEGNRAVLLANHGIVTGGKDLGQAFSVMEEVEYLCHLYLLTKPCGGPVVLDDAEIEKMQGLFQSYGQPHRQGEH